MCAVYQVTGLRAKRAPRILVVPVHHTALSFLSDYVNLHKGDLR
jgi:hypothetical protein